MAFATAQIQPADTVFKNFTQSWGELYGGRTAHDPQGFLHKTAILEQLSNQGEKLFLIFDMTTYRAVYVGNGVEKIFGYTREDLKRWNVLLYFRCLARPHLTFPLTVGKWSYKMEQYFARACPGANLSYTFCGIMVRRKNGEMTRLLVHVTPIETDQKGHPLLTLISVENVSHLMKGDFYWGRICASGNCQMVATYHSEGTESKFEDIVSSREKEVLKLIATGQSSKEIADQLFISQNTVEKHRKNMLARTGVKDTTALVHLCMACNVL